MPTNFTGAPYHFPCHTTPSSTSHLTGPKGGITLTLSAMSSGSPIEESGVSERVNVFLERTRIADASFFSPKLVDRQELFEQRIQIITYLTVTLFLAQGSKARKFPSAEDSREGREGRKGREGRRDRQSLH